MPIKFLLRENCRFPKLMENRSLPIVPGHHAHIYHDTYYRRPFWCIAHQYNVVYCGIFLSRPRSPRSNVINGTRRTPCNTSCLRSHAHRFSFIPAMLYVLIRYTDDLSYLYIIHYTWSNLTHSLSIRSSVATNIIMRTLIKKIAVSKKYQLIQLNVAVTNYQANIY